ncbi:MAG: CusA/CzcA family heavy metal efflux RND transporter [Holophagales bacterium]|jgi:Cu(I)/Ag(I) efflux system membrane protein CusA/SilA|nr:CusA/CzcA family heavy metal efflux RND transporter [Holophagales bacterium]
MRDMHGPSNSNGFLARIIKFSAENRFLVVAATILLLAVSVWSMRNIPLDALPDLSDTQVIVYTKWDRSPDIVEDQVTYPIVASLLGAPKVKAVRGITDFGFSYVYVIFEDDTDLYWARSRVLEYLSKITSNLPQDAVVELGPDATSVGWIFQYALVDRTGKHSSDELRSLHDWFMKYAIQSVSGVAEVASVGGQVRQFQISVDPNKMANHGVNIHEVVDAVKAANNEAGGRLIEYAGREYMVRGRGYAKTPEDFASAFLKTENGTPIRIGDVATVNLGPEMRRGLTDLDGIGDAVSGIVVMRQRENALNVISAVKERLEELKKSLPDGVEIVTVYDRSDLIKSSISTVTNKLIEEMIIVSLVILVFLWHFPSAIVPIITIPVSVALAFIPLLLIGQNANLMSLAGIAISIGVLVDGAIVEVENAYKKIEIWNSSGRPGAFHEVRLSALLEVGPAVFYSLLVVAVSFIPIFTLVDQEGRLFKPLAYSKNLAMAIAALLAITLDPAIRMMFARPDPFHFRPAWLSRATSSIAVGKYHPEEKHPVSRLMYRIYERPCRFILRHAKMSIAASIVLVALTAPVFFKLGSEFMPPLNEGAILYMPSTLPGLNQTEAMRILQVQDRLIGQVPEVKLVFGKAGRADTATDPAPLSMMETLIELKPESEWREHARWYSGWAPEWLKAMLRPFWRDKITFDDIIRELDSTVRLPAIPNAWTMPIKARIDMLSTGIRTPVGLKVNGPDLAVIDEIAVEAEGILSKTPGTRSVFAERLALGYFLDFELKRDKLARYGLSVEDANMLVMRAIGGDNQTVVFDGRARYPVNVRYARDYRENPDALARLNVSLHNGTRIAISDIADIKMSEGPAMIRNENGMLNGYVLLDFDTSRVDVGTYVKNAKALADAELQLPTGYSLTWSGQFENMIRVKDRLKIILPITLILIFGLIYANTRSAVKTWIVMLAVPFSAIGAFWLLWLLDYNLSIAVWVGLIALMGLDAETGVFMLLFLDLSYEEASAKNQLNTREELKEAVVHGAVKRVRPKAMTVLSGIVGLLPILWSLGSGADLMKRIAAPMVGGLTTSFILELLIYPAVYYLWKGRGLPRGVQH